MLGINCHRLSAQDSVEKIINRNVMAGFENMRVSVTGKTLNISYENNLYRNKSLGLSKVLDNLSVSGYDTLRVVMLYNDLPIVVATIGSEDFQQFKKGRLSAVEATSRMVASYKTDNTWRILRTVKPVNSHVNKFDLVFYPQISVMNVLLSQIYEVQFNIAPALEVSLWRGMKFTGQVIFPIANHFVFGDEGNLIRSGIISLAQEFRLPGTILGRAVFGKFNSDRYGADLSLTHYLLKGRAYVKINGGYTGTNEYRNGQWFRNDLKTLTGFLKAGYYYTPLNVQLDGSAGRYLNGDYGLRGDCTRYFGETAVGFFAMLGSGTLNGGFHFTIPIGTRKFKKNRTFQMRAPSYFAWEYNAGTDFYYGQIYKTRPDENRVEQFYNPNFIIKNLLK